MAELTGLEPVTSAVTGQRSKPTELQLQIFFLVAKSGFEPKPSGYEPEMLPLHYLAIKFVI
jgi:hypothetical protein